ncbi:hypothetical protein EV2_024958 [Malus domestica]
MAFPAWHKLFTRHLSFYFFDPLHLIVLAESLSHLGTLWYARLGMVTPLGCGVETMWKRFIEGDCVRAPTPEDITMNNFDSNTQSYTFDKLTFKSISSIKLAPTGSSEHLSALRDYLESFDCSEDMSLYIQDAKSFIFPESFRKTCSPPLRNLKHNVTAKMPPATEAEDSELRGSLLWIAPSAYIPQIEHWT